ncbi:hypothetical protein MKX08_003635 [Trichoderma sp. CBMAI-0020]|nr:hypothetical protein MKX08_003635 [Trichoderma sp. CBMAI-0020]
MILECGFGAGDWSVDVAEQYPDAELCRFSIEAATSLAVRTSEGYAKPQAIVDNLMEWMTCVVAMLMKLQVIGLDISPHMIPEELPDNLDLQVDDLNADQLMAGGIRASRWQSYMKDIYRVLQPGGWCQMVEMYLNAQSDNGTLSPDHALSRWSSGYLDAMHPQKDPRAALRLKDWMTSAGFVDIESRLLTLPMCPWPSDPRDHEIGTLNAGIVSQLLYSLGLYPFTKMRDMPLEDFQLMVAQARNESTNPSYRAYFPL